MMKDNSDNESPIKTADFLRNVELSAKKILRDDKQRLKNKNSLITSYKQHLHQNKDKNDQLSSLLNHNELHHKLKDSPFYDAWEEWNKDKSMKKPTTSNSNIDDGMYVRDIKRDSINAYIGRNKGKSSSKSSLMKKVARFDMKEHLTTKSLRKRFRCDQDLMLDERNNHNSFKTRGNVAVDSNNSVSIENQTNREEVEESVHVHPLEEYLFNHVNTITARMKSMTRKRIQSIQPIKDLQSCWDLSKKGLNDDNVLMAKGEERCEEINGDNCQLQSVPLDKATQAYWKDDTSNTDKLRCSPSSNNLKVLSPSNKSKLIQNHGNEENDACLKITPEYWPLLIEEDLFDGELKVSMHLMRNRDDEKENEEGEESKHEQSESWFIDVYDRSYQNLKTFVFQEHEIAEIIKKVNLPTSTPKTEIQCVHDQEIIKDVCGSEMHGRYSVRIFLNEQKDIVAIIEINFDDVESHYGMAQNAPIEVICPVYEIIARLELYYVCKACDYKFWISEENGRMIWDQLIDRLNVHLVSDEIVKDIQTNIFGISWIPQEAQNDKDEIKWIQPSVVESDRYFATLDKAYELFHRFETFCNEQNLTRELGILVENETKRNDILMKMRMDIDELPPKSMRLLGNVAFSKKLVPGACTIGKRGIGFISDEVHTDESEDISFKREADLDPTQAVASFHHHESKKGSPFNTVTMSLAFERPILTKSFLAWDPNPVLGSFNKGQPPSNIIPSEMAKGIQIMKEPLVSVFDKWQPPPVISCDEPNSRDHAKWKLENMNISDNVFQSNGFRLRSQAHEIHYDKNIESKAFGISEKALSPNQTKVNNRSHWTSKEFCTELLSKERGPEDFFHLLQNEFTDKDGGLTNQPLISVIHMKAYDVKCIRGIKRDKYIEAKKLQKQQQQLEAKRKVLSDKILSADKIMAKRLHDQLCLEEKYYFDSRSAHATENKPSLNDISSNRETTSDSFKIIPTNDVLSDEGTQLRGYGWRKLPKSSLGADFFELNKRKIQNGSNGDMYNRCNKVRLIGRVNVRDEIDYKVDDKLFEIKLETRSIQDVLVDRIEVSRATEKQEYVKDKLLTAHQEEALEHILNVPLMKPKIELKDVVENNANDVIATFLKEGHETQKEDELIQNTNYMHQKRERDNEDSKVLVAVKHSNYDVLKEIIDYQGIDVDTYDEYGNTLFILACQQGNKKMCKFLLRRGAYINAQNHAGNTGLHYLFEYGHVELAEYIRQKGADDSYLNAEGLTCFEGVNRNNLDAL